MNKLYPSPAKSPVPSQPFVKPARIGLQGLAAYHIFVPIGSVPAGDIWQLWSVSYLGMRHLVLRKRRMGRMETMRGPLLHFGRRERLSGRLSILGERTTLARTGMIREVLGDRIIWPLHDIESRLLLLVVSLVS